ncbi:TMEM175 family protein [Scytonema sp. UIC 10036]|uniref:TMEM175 family protein n=1 Tax=Scytonema sp. UIC 10036 TaxID=2304196 RepID=UPI00140FD61C|nr:TMEM175 family protein [Scytonema sp. UIC 10036]
MQKSRTAAESDTQRIEAFSDAVFAIAITLLILEIRVPELNSTEGTPSLVSGLFALWPSYFAYIFSFVVIGIFWANHHYVFQLYERSDQVFRLFNLLFLMCISFLPFPTAVLARCITDAQQLQTVVVLYALVLFLSVLTWLLIWLYASRNHRLLNRHLDDKFIAYLTRMYILTSVLYFLALVLSLWNGIAGLVLCVGLTLLYTLPPKKPVYRSGA